MAIERFTHPLEDEAFWEAQRQGSMVPHVEPVNRFIDELAARKGEAIPRVAPMHGGVEARVLSILRDPGPMTDRTKGTGLLSVFNPDQTAATQRELFENEGIDPWDVLPWNAYPWYINRAPSPAERGEGARVLRELLELLPGIQIVFLQGADAANMWRKFEALNAGYAADRSLVVINSLHPSRQALWHRDPAERDRRVQRRIDAYQRVGALLRSEDIPVQAPPAPTGRGSEAIVEQSFAEYLTADGWDVRRHVDYCDVVATKNGATLKAEVKGRTGSSMGLDVDTLFGQLLRRFPGNEQESFIPAVVVPADALAKVQRVPEWVMERLRIEVFTVAEDGTVRKMRGEPSRDGASEKRSRRAVVSLLDRKPFRPAGGPLR